MADYERMLVVENGQMVFIQNEVGVSIAFSSFEEAQKVTSHDFTGKFYVGYEPHINLFRDSRDESITNEMIPNIQYEGFIDNVAVYLERQRDPLYGLSVEDALITVKGLKRAEILSRYQVEEDLLVYTTGGAVYSASPANITEIFVEHQLALANSETQIVVFDTEDEPHVVAMAQVVPALQGMRTLARALQVKGKGYLTTIKNATILEDVQAVEWVV